MLLVGPPDEGASERAGADLDAKITEALATYSVKDAASVVAAESGQPRRLVYARAIEIAAGTLASTDYDFALVAATLTVLADQPDLTVALGALKRELPVFVPGDWLTYPVLKMSEMPEMKVVLIHRPEVGNYGQGSEAANALCAPAIAAALFDATGKPARSLPFKPAKVKELLKRFGSKSRVDDERFADMTQAVESLLEHAEQQEAKFSETTSQIKALQESLKTLTSVQPLLIESRPRILFNPDTRSAMASRAERKMIGTQDSARSRRHTAKPSSLGSITSSTTRSGCSW